MNLSSLAGSTQSSDHRLRLSIGESKSSEIGVHGAMSSAHMEILMGFEVGH